MPAAQIEVSWKYTYRDTCELVLQQMDSRFRRFVSEDSYSGEGARPVQRIGEANSQEITVRGETITPKELEHTGRWITPRDWDVGPYLEYDIDKVRNNVELTGKWGMAARKAYNRRLDDLVIGAATASAMTGKNGTGTPSTFDTATMRVAADSAGMTVSKLREMRRRFRQKELDLDEEPLYLAISAVQEEDLLADVQITSRDFGWTEKPVLRDGNIERFLGFNFVHSERLLTDGSGNRRCIAWTPKGLHLGIWKEWESDVDVNKNIRGYPVQSYMKFKANATRLDEERVGEILCAES